MSALGQNQTYAVHQAMSALPLKADMCGATGDVRFGPKADMLGLFDQLIGTDEQRQWQLNPNCLGGLRIDK